LRDERRRNLQPLGLGPRNGGAAARPGQPRALHPGDAGEQARDARAVIGLRPGSITIRVCPTRGACPSASKNDPASVLKALPVKAAARISTISASAVPLASPIGTIVPFSAASASVVWLPSTSSAQFGGISRPAFFAAMTFPRATLDSDRSITSGGAPATGVAKAMGLVPKTGWLAPHGAMALGAFAIMIAISPASA
jgi:hypothetical protein